MVQRARELDKLKLGARKKEVEKSWWKRAAEEAELVLSESEGEEAEEERGGKTKVKAVERQRIAQKQAELDALLDVPLTSMGFSGKYPTKTGKLEMPDQFSGERRSDSLPSMGVMLRDDRFPTPIYFGPQIKAPNRPFPL